MDQLDLVFELMEKLAEEADHHFVSPVNQNRLHIVIIPVGYTWSSPLFVYKQAYHLSEDSKAPVNMAQLLQVVQSLH